MFFSFFFLRYCLWLIPRYCTIIFLQNIRDFKIFVTRSMFIKLCSFLKNHTSTNFSVVTDIVAFDLLDASKLRFSLLYTFLSIVNSMRVTVQFFIPENTTVVTSLSFLYNSVEWSEREVWDMFGIYFSQHFDLRRLLTDYTFSNFPLRKEFPLSGFVEIFYDDFFGVTVFERAEFAQGMRPIIDNIFIEQNLVL